MAPPDKIWHKESLKLKEIFGTREGFEICPHQLSPGPIKASVGIFHGDNFFKNLFHSGRFAAQIVSQDWSSGCHFRKATSREPLSLTPPPPRYPPPPRQTFFPIPQKTT